MGICVLCSKTTKQVTVPVCGVEGKWREPRAGGWVGANHTGLCGIQVSSGGTWKCPISPASICGALHLTRCLTACDSPDRMQCHSSVPGPLLLLPGTSFPNVGTWPTFIPSLRLSSGVISCGRTSQIVCLDPIFAPPLDFPWPLSEYLACLYNFSFVCRPERPRATWEQGVCGAHPCIPSAQAHVRLIEGNICVLNSPKGRLN